MGSVYKRGKVYWIKYYRNGKPFRESTESRKEADAKRLLKKREGEISQGKMPGIYFDKIKFNELADDFIMDYQINQRKSLNRAELSVMHLKKFFEGDRVTTITTPRIQEYILSRMGSTCLKCGENVGVDTEDICPKCGKDKFKPGAANGTINRELSALRRMLNLGAQQTPPKVDKVPHIPMLKENNARKGFFEHSHFLALQELLPEYLKGFVSFAYKTGWRLSEITNLTWNQVDLDQGIVRLDVGETKNDEARTVYLDEELKEIFNRQWEHQKKKCAIAPHVFPNAEGTGKIIAFFKAWNHACRETGIGFGYRVSSQYVKKWSDKLSPGPTIHDFRRSACRNMVRSGIPERVAMTISGHKTRDIFDRYNIVSDADLKRAAKQQEAYLKNATGTISGTISHFPAKKGQPKSANPLK